MLGLRLGRIHFKGGVKLCRFYLSNEFKNLQGGCPESSYWEDSKGQRRNGKSDMNNYSMKLKTQPTTTTNYEVARYLLDNGNIPDLLSIISNRTQHGMYLDNFTSCYILDHLLEKNDFSIAAQVAKVILSQEDLDSKLVAALSIKSLYDYLRKTHFSDLLSSTVASEEKKIRVKYVRKPSVAETENITDFAGKVFLNFPDKYSKQICLNLKCLGLLICNKTEEFVSTINSFPSEICTDILNECQVLIKNKNEAQKEVLDCIEYHLEKSQQSQSFDNLLHVFIKETINEEEPILIRNQKNKLKVSEDSQSEHTKREHVLVRQAIVEDIMADIQKNQQRLWYFALKEKIDLDIYRKRVTYPKRWFGKKKNPKVVDNDYVPPEITKKVY